MRRYLTTLFACLTLTNLPLLADEITFQDGETERTVSGLIVSTHESGVVLHEPDGTMWPIRADRIVDRKRQPEDSFQPLGEKALAESMLGRLPPGFQTLETANYLVCYNTSREYAQWCGTLLERLNRGFFSYWTQRGFRLEKPRQPLVAIVFDSQENFAEYAKAELWEAATGVIGYYSMHTNHVVMFDLTGGLAQGNGRGKVTPAMINRQLARPDLQWNLATVVHEATHQLAFNTGLQQRYADLPLWVSEGLAIYFETPDLSSSRGWRGIGQVNTMRLDQYRKMIRNHPEPRLPVLLSDDGSFRKAATALDSYAHSWALTYFLLKRYPDEYNAYLKSIGEIQPLHDPPPGTRVRHFQEHFGADLDKLENQLRDYMATLRGQ